ncbi:S-layer homology domain-containing protein [uncultured Cetobacterium sp.]|uniref:S-layer homology domain-containing protein n=1 Tax=uncultured Cetobacterium sp. TaxID=527638 RepID=UPI00262E6DB5|nr:S-layer homology domain-containing protein [uncultured Cetobacterium sp.]
MKKIIMIYFILIALVYGQEKQLIFEDVPKNHWAYKAIENLVNEGIISENSFLFRGEFPVSRYSFAEGLNRSFETLNEKKANRGDLVILESLVYEFSRELTRVGFDSETFSGKIENIKIDIEFIRKKNDETQIQVNELKKRVEALEKNAGI